MNLNSRILEIAHSHIGTREIRGDKDNPKIVAWFAAAGASWIKNDEAAWCSAFACGVAQEAGAFNPRTVRARDWLLIPEHGATPVGLSNLQPGDVCVVSRGNNLAHVSFFVTHTTRGALLLCGGNQANTVNVSRYDFGRLIGAMRLNSAQPTKPLDHLPLA